MRKDRAEYPSAFDLRIKDFLFNREEETSAKERDGVRIKLQRGSQMLQEAANSLSQIEDGSGKPRPPHQAGGQKSLRIESNGGEQPVIVGMKTWQMTSSG